MNQLLQNEQVQAALIAQIVAMIFKARGA